MHEGEHVNAHSVSRKFGRDAIFGFEILIYVGWANSKFCENGRWLFVGVQNLNRNILMSYILIKTHATFRLDKIIIKTYILKIYKKMIHSLLKSEYETVLKTLLGLCCDCWRER
jgi:hypothetical protein